MTLHRKSRALMRQIRLQMAEMDRLKIPRKVIAIELNVTLAMVSRHLGRSPFNKMGRKGST